MNTRPQLTKVDLPGLPITFGDWTIDTFSVGNTSDDLQLMRLAFQGRGIPPGTYTRLRHKQRGVVMSDTPAEMSDHWPVTDFSGRVLVAGLGIGMVLQALANAPDVERVHVIEFDKGVIDNVWPIYAERYGDKVSIEHADALTRKPKPGETYDCAWWDIWDTICADNYDDMKMLVRRWSRRIRVQESWSRAQVRRMIREEREYERDWGCILGRP